MKKLLLLLILVTTVLTGCSGEEKTVCNFKAEQDGIAVESVYTIFHTGDKVSSIETTEKIEADAAIIEVFSTQFEAIYEMISNEVEGYAYESTSTETTYEVTVSIDYETVNVEALKTYDATVEALFEEDGSVKLDTIIELYGTTIGATCN